MGVKPRVVRQLVEDPRLHVVEQRRDVLRRRRPPDPAGKRRIALTVKIVFPRELVPPDLMTDLAGPSFGCYED